jgi:hypothetical protein
MMEATSTSEISVNFHRTVIYLYKLEVVCLCVYMCVCSLIVREGKKQFTPNLARLFLETRKITQGDQNSEEIVLSSIPSEGGSCTSETKHDIRTAPRPELFRRGYYRNKCQNSEKLS